MIRRQLPFDDYCQMPQVNASSLATALSSWLDYKYQRDTGYQVSEDAVRVGSAAHLIVEYLPVDKFRDLFCVQPDFHLSPDNRTSKGDPSIRRGTTYCKEMEADFAANEARTVLKRSEYNRLVRIVQGISANDEAMELIVSSHREETVDAMMEGVECKGRVDGVVGTLEWDLKTTNAIDEQAFSRTVRNFRYLFKDSFRTLLLAANELEISEFKYLVALDERTAEGARPKHAPQCVVVDVPIVVIENYFELVRDKLRELKQCEATGRWPGMDPYTLQLNSWDMPAVTLVD